MEVYRNEIEQLRHYVVEAGSIKTADGPVSVKIFDPEGNEVFSDEANLVTNAPKPYYVKTVGTDVTNLGAGHTVQWSYAVNQQPVVKREQLLIVTPYISMSALQTNPELEGYETYALRAMERLVAGVIDVYTNQTFNREDDVSITVRGQDSDSLPLPKRLVHLDRVELMDYDQGITPYPLTDYVVLDPNDRWTLRRRVVPDMPRKMTPTTRYRFFKYPAIYSVTGDWGWEFVPADVTRAATILVREYFCEDAKYRDKFIANIRAGDWRMEFKLTGDETTGSANADMLLTAYRNVGMAII